jgi:hypothetical protein
MCCLVIERRRKTCFELYNNLQSMVLLVGYLVNPELEEKDNAPSAFSQPLTRARAKEI